MNKLIDWALPLLYLLAVACLLIFGGWKWRDWRADAEIAAMQAAQAAALAESQAAYADALDKARAAERAANQRAADISAAAAAQSDQIRANVRQKKQGIDNAIKQDGADCADGLCAHSLRHYRQSLGYAD